VDQCIARWHSDLGKSTNVVSITLAQTKIYGAHDTSITHHMYTNNITKGNTLHRLTKLDI